MYLVDTDVLSACAPTKVRGAPHVAKWMERHSDALYPSVITIAEVEGGIAKSRREGAVRKADRLAEWLETVLHLYRERVLLLDVAVARKLGELVDRARGAGMAPGLADLVIAATAASRGYIILTHNARHFDGLRVPMADPFTALPEDAT